MDRGVLLLEVINTIHLGKWGQLMWLKHEIYEKGGSVG